jgi:outer membrane protein TolC
MKLCARFSRFFILIATLGFLWNATATAEPLPFRRAVELALSHSGTMAIATAEQSRAFAGYMEARNAYIPQVIVGSGLAYSYGFPLSIEGSAPSVVNLNAQSYLLNAAQREFVKAAKTDWQASAISMEDRRNQVVLDTALTYAELDKVASQLNLIRQQEQDALRQQDISQQRLQAGIDSPMDLTRARLAAARVRTRQAELRGAGEQLRAHLAELTGLPADGMETVTESLPQLPTPADDSTLVSKVLDLSPAVRLAGQQALAQEQRARAEHKQWYPAVDLVGQYGLFSRFNNYDQYFLKFQRHNATFGVAIRFPFLNFSQRARAEGADADALKARKQVEGVKNQVSAGVLKTQGAVRQLSAAREVARLEYEVARGETEAAGARVQSGAANLKDEETARLNEAERYGAFLDVTFELEKAQLQLLRASGDLEKWALGR